MEYWLTCETLRHSCDIKLQSFESLWCFVLLRRRCPCGILASMWDSATLLWYQTPVVWKTLMFCTSKKEIVPVEYWLTCETLRHCCDIELQSFESLWCFVLLRRRCPCGILAYMRDSATLLWYRTPVVWKALMFCTSKKEMSLWNIGLHARLCDIVVISNCSRLKGFDVLYF